MKSALKLSQCVVLVILAAQCLAGSAPGKENIAGGYTEQEISPEVRKTVQQVLVGIQNTANNPQYDIFKTARKALVGYASQVVAGLNHSILFKLKGNKQYSYSCIKVYQNLQDEYTISSVSFGLSYEDSKTLCYTNPNNRKASKGSAQTDSDL